MVDKNFLKSLFDCYFEDITFWTEPAPDDKVYLFITCPKTKWSEDKIKIKTLVIETRKEPMNTEKDIKKPPSSFRLVSDLTFESKPGEPGVEKFYAIEYQDETGERTRLSVTREVLNGFLASIAPAIQAEGYTERIEKSLEDYKTEKQEELENEKKNIG